eukprot:CAMPEP_0194292662 /NCGR_PEP_ID=MMETSP0169-20130528/46159_1 /TAXON_ID=218684 /ORGANISM="Corethron pennatum, Strain L29A3" /LENGTH=155 /DNA_ID=CAMNT_0039040911 /DNA_START=439 /DNA_END=906 /DNA_ORIENTATION=+
MIYSKKAITRFSHWRRGYGFPNYRRGARFFIFVTAAACHLVCFYLASAPKFSVAAPATAADSVITGATAAATAVTVTVATASWIIVVVFPRISPSHFYVPISLSISVTAAVVAAVSAPAATVVPSVPVSPASSATALAPAPDVFRARLLKPLESS